MLFLAKIILGCILFLLAILIVLTIIDIILAIIER